MNLRESKKGFMGGIQREERESGKCIINIVSLKIKEKEGSSFIIDELSHL